MSGSRAGSASHSRKVKERLVKALFGKEYSKHGPSAHQKLDFASYTYEQLRKAYIEKIQLLHPDKYQSREFRNMEREEQTSVYFHERKPWDEIEPTTWLNTQDAMKQKNPRDKQQAFVDLKDAWDEYDKIAKVMKKGIGRETQSNFTMFGVGCSFSDSPDEQQKRAEIMDQACRGWFSAGQLPATITNGNDETSGNKEMTSCVSDSKRRNSSPDGESFAVTDCTEISSSPGESASRRRSLIDHLIVKRT
jgi:hypothetical protein